MSSSSCNVHAPQLLSHFSAAIAKANANGTWKANHKPRGPSPCTDAALIGTIAAIAEASAVVAVELRHSIVEKKAHENEFGDAVLSVDLIADAAIAKHLKASPHVATFASEEHPILVETDAYIAYKKAERNYANAAAAAKAVAAAAAAANARRANLNAKVNGVPAADASSSSSSSAVVSSSPNSSAVVAATKAMPKHAPQTCVTFDPLDGSSIIDTNFSVGTIYAVWAGDSPIGQKAGDLCASVIVVYGPRCVMYVAEPRVGVLGYMLYDDRHWHLTQSKPFTIAPKAKIFSPGNLRAVVEHRGYRKFIQNLVMKRGLTLRYTGGMVPDAMQMLNKGNGLFTTPISESFKVKLRVCFECAPIAFMMHCAGAWSICDATTAEPKFVGGAGGDTNNTTAASYTISGGSYMDVLVTSIDQRSAVGLGSASDIVAYWRAVKSEATSVAAKKKLAAAKL